MTDGGVIKKRDHVGGGRAYRETTRDRNKLQTSPDRTTREPGGGSVVTNNDTSSVVDVGLDHKMKLLPKGVIERSS